MSALETTRIHEAAHACAAVELRLDLGYASVERGPWNTGH
jgi:hypothetical protein